jgi:hypothetical protein
VYRFNVSNSNPEVEITLLYDPEDSSFVREIEFIIWDEEYGYEEHISHREERNMLIRTGSLTRGAWYFLHIYNNSLETVEYCLIPWKVGDWIRRWEDCN